MDATTLVSVAVEELHKMQPHDRAYVLTNLVLRWCDNCGRDTYLKSSELRCECRLPIELKNETPNSKSR